MWTTHTGKLAWAGTWALAQAWALAGALTVACKNHAQACGGSVGVLHRHNQNTSLSFGVEMEQTLPKH